MWVCERKGAIGNMSKKGDIGADRFRKRHDREERHKDALPTEDDAPLLSPVEPIHTERTPSRNDPCPCGSGKKYKQCCGKN